MPIRKKEDRETFISIAAHGLCGYCKELFIDNDLTIETYDDGSWDFVAQCPKCRRSFRGYNP